MSTLVNTYGELQLGDVLPGHPRCGRNPAEPPAVLVELLHKRYIDFDTHEPSELYVQVGFRDTVDGEITRWSAPATDDFLSPAIRP